MVRLLTASSILALLALGGLAMAEDGRIVDPWRRVVAAVTVSESAPPVPTLTSVPVGVASFPINEPKAQPSVVPVGPPLAAGNGPAVVVPVGPATGEGIFDPWASAPTTRDTTRLVTSRVGRRDWAFEIDEIVDPWSKGPLAVVTDPLIVDPWAR